MVRYHDEEWGQPQHDDRWFFEMLVLEGAQAGLSWLTIIKRREAYRKAFANWDWQKVARFTEKDIQKRLGPDSGIIRNRRKVEGAVKNARAFIELREKEGSFDRYIWSFTDGEVLIPETPPRHWKDLPTETELSALISKDLRKRGFCFVGPVIVYAFMQSFGMVNDHMEGCFLSPHR